jgi:hypothetical protein
MFGNDVIVTEQEDGRRWRLPEPSREFSRVKRQGNRDSGGPVTVVAHFVDRVRHRCRTLLVVLSVAAAIRSVMAAVRWLDFATPTANIDCPDDHSETWIDSAPVMPVTHDDFRLWEAEFA